MLDLSPVTRDANWQRVSEEIIIAGDNCSVAGLGLANNIIIPLITNLQASLKAQPTIAASNLAAASSPRQENSVTAADSSANTAQTTCDNSTLQELNIANL